MNILWVKPGKLLPLDTGGKLRSYNILRHLSGGTNSPTFPITAASATRLMSGRLSMCFPERSSSIPRRGIPLRWSVILIMRAVFFGARHIGQQVY